jgi:hypothetical protein
MLPEMTHLLLLAAFDGLPQQVKDTVKYGVWLTAAVCVMLCLFKVIRGAERIDRGEDGKKMIFSGLLIAAAPWIVVVAFQVTGIWDSLGLELF